MFSKRSSRERICMVVFHANLALAMLLSGCSPLTVPAASTLQPVIDTLPPSQTQTPSIVNTMAPLPTQTSPVAFPLNGIWVGSLKNGTFEMQIKIILQAYCLPGDICGTFDLPNMPCSGTFTLVNEENGVYEFRAGNKQGACGEGRDFLQLLPGNWLKYTSRGDFGESLGILVPDKNLPSPSPAAQMLPVIYDDDGSPDGTTALLYLLSNPGVSLKAVIVSHGEAHPQTYIQHLGRMLDNFGIVGLPLGAGQDGPLAGSNGFPEWLRQSADNFWGLPLPNPQKTYKAPDASQLMVSILNQAAQPVTIFLSGPCTDLARALRLDSGIRKKIKAVYIMGGAIHVPGNLSDILPNSTNVSAEWNIYADPQAAREVFVSGLDIYLVPLDATNQVKITMTDTGHWRNGGKMADFGADIFDMLLKKAKTPNIAIWDLMTAEIMAKPDLCSFQLLNLDIITTPGNTSGQTIVQPAGKPINVCLNPNTALIKQTLVDTFTSSQ